jgi:hypothetical protein
VQLGLSHLGKNVGSRCSKMGCWGKMLVPRREDVTGDRRKLQVREVHDLYSTPNRPYQPANKIKEKRLAIMWCVWGENRNVCSCLVGTDK